MSGGFQVAEAETLVRSKAERQQAAVDASRRKRRDAEATGSAPRTAAADVSNSTPQAEDKRRKDEQAAAARIQSMQRGKQARRELQEQRRAVTRIAAVQRGKHDRRKVLALRMESDESPDSTLSRKSFNVQNELNIATESIDPERESSSTEDDDSEDAGE